MAQRRDGHPTVSDVAREAGVSRATAARALGGYGQVSEATADIVQAAAARVGYRPNVLARSMVTGSTKTLGVVVADIEDRFFARVVRGIADVAHAAGFEVVLANSDEHVAEERAAVAVLCDKQVDGLIVAPASTVDVAHLNEAIDRGWPLVLLDRAAPQLGVDAIVIDNRTSADKAVEHLIGLGHRRIAVVAPRGPAVSGVEERAREGSSDTTPTTERLRGYVDAMERAGLTVAEELIRRCAYDRAAAAAEATAVLHLPEPATAIFATDALMSLGVVDSLRSSGICVPDEVSIVGFDDPEWTTIVEPPLTVVAQPVYELGRTAAARLLEYIHGRPDGPRTTILPTSFVIRGSTAPIQGRGQAK